MGELDFGRFSNLEHVVLENGRAWRFLEANRWAILQGRIMVGRELWGALSARFTCRYSRASANCPKGKQ